MVETEIITGTLIYSHILPVALGFFSVIFIANGIMDRHLPYTLIGIVLFLAAGILPFLILPFVVGV
ncbi:MAG: hypothetical protein KO217_01465 [Methanobacteriaceae archaeon]|jgi:hypothetical protein|nr:MAG: hypothetical protein CIT01_00920 [Methanobacterium sp. BRmetb2]MCC7557338.1 hypothetical protein [Methanobacteriaceae archaeon]